MGVELEHHTVGNGWQSAVTSHLLGWLLGGSPGRSRSVDFKDASALHESTQFIQIPSNK